MSKKIVIAAGGTGGHLYPAMQTAHQILSKHPEWKVLFAGGGLKENPFFDRKSFAWEEISTAPLAKMLSLSVFKNSASIAKGIWQSYRVLSSFKPDLIVGFGSYHSFPLLFAANVQKYPLILHEQNSKPGKVIRFFSKKALLTGIYFPSAGELLKGNSKLLSMPLREGFSCPMCTKEKACSYFGIDPKKFTVLIFGGSQGAQFFNGEVAKQFSSCDSGSIQILHFAGSETGVEAAKKTYAASKVQAIVKPLEKRMDYAWKVADLAIVRAGAGTIAEQIKSKVPAIYIPYPHSADGHQESNADFVVNTVKGGWKWSEKQWNGESFSALLQQLVQPNSAQIAEKLQNLQAYKKCAPSEDFSTLLLDLISRPL